MVDTAARDLGVERRRIYDVVNILESIRLVSKEKKNTYKWMGTCQMDEVLGELQAQAILEYPEDAKALLGVIEENQEVSTPKLPLSAPKSHNNKSLAKLSQEFLQVYLVGFKTLSLPEASDKIQGATSIEELVSLGGGPSLRLNPDGTPNHDDEKQRKAAAARGLKTKIRRLYDIANVFISVGILEKVDTLTTSVTRRPNFSWSYKLNGQEIRELHLKTVARKSQSDPPANVNVPAAETPAYASLDLTNHDFPAQTRGSDLSTPSVLPLVRQTCDSVLDYLNDLPLLSEEEKRELDAPFSSCILQQDSGGQVEDTRSAIM